MKLNHIKRKGRYGFCLKAPGGFTTEVDKLEGTGGAP